MRRLFFIDQTHSECDRGCRASSAVPPGNHVDEFLMSMHVTQAASRSTNSLQVSRQRSIGRREKVDEGNTWWAWVGYRTLVATKNLVPTANTGMQEGEDVAEGALGRGGRVVVKHDGPVDNAEGLLSMHGECLRLP